MNCQQCSERMALYLAEALAGKWGRQFEQHLEQCSECAKKLREKQQILQMLHNLPAPSPPEDLSARIKASIQAKIRRPRFWSQPARYLKVAAACAAVIVAVSFASLSPIRTLWQSSPDSASAPHALTASVPETVEATQPQAESSMVVASAGERVAPAEAKEELAESAVVASLPRSGESTLADLVPPAVAAAAEESSLASGAESLVMPEAEPKRGVDESQRLRLARASAVRISRPEAISSAEVPNNLVRAALRIDSGAELPVAVAQSPQGSDGSVVAQTLVGTVVANAVVNQYVREAIIETDETMMALTTSAPASMIKVSATEENAPVE